MSRRYKRATHPFFLYLSLSSNGTCTVDRFGTVTSTSDESGAHDMDSTTSTHEKDDTTSCDLNSNTLSVLASAVAIQLPAGDSLTFINLFRGELTAIREVTEQSATVEMHVIVYVN